MTRGFRQTERKTTHESFVLLLVDCVVVAVVGRAT